LTARRELPLFLDQRTSPITTTQKERQGRAAAQPVWNFALPVGGARYALSHAYPRRGLPFQRRHVSPLRRSFQTRPRHPTKWQVVEPVVYESPLRAPLRLRGYEQNELARLRRKRNVRLRSERKVRQALHSETIALVSWRYRLPQNGTPRQALLKCAGTSSPASNLLHLP